jgi:lysophospholipase L1-like esterase
LKENLAIEASVGTWGASPAAPIYFIPVEFIPAPFPVQGTIRYRLRVSAGGSRLRLRLSNEAGDRALMIGGATIGLACETAACIHKGTLTRVNFSCLPTARILPGAVIVSDPIDLQVAHHGDLIVSLYLPQPFMAAQGGDTHKAALSAGQDSVMSIDWPDAASINVRPIVSAVSVVPLRPTRTVVTLGDSITDGSSDATGCLPFAFRGWPDILAQRLNERAATDEKRVAPPGKEITAYSVVNAGIGGNCLLKNFIGIHALARLDRDVFAIPGVSHLIVLEGLNDIGIGGRTIDGLTYPNVSADELIAGYRQVIERAHEQGIKVIGATLPPFRDAFYFLEEKELVRQAVNDWIRNAASFDGLIDFDRVLHDPSDPSRLRTDFDTGDHLHPNMAAFKAMGDAIDLEMFSSFATAAEPRK